MRHHNYWEWIRPDFNRRCVFLLLVLMAATGLAACGKKPVHIDPPPGVEDDPFPRIYPDPSLDPSPDIDARPDLAPKNPAPPPHS